MPNRRDLLRFGAVSLGGVFSALLAVPGVRFLLGPLASATAERAFQPLTRLGQLKAGEPQAFAVIAERRDAWVKYPREPIGSVWLVRQPEGSNPPVLAFSAECPHLSCPIGLTPDRKGFLCPCHGARFTLSGAKENAVSARGMDALAVELSGGADPEVRVRFERYQPQVAEKKPLA